MEWQALEFFGLVLVFVMFLFSSKIVDALLDLFGKREKR